MIKLFNDPASRMAKAWVLAATCWISSSPESPAQTPVRLHPGNGHYFEFRGRPVVLMGSSEHYGALINLDFDYIRYLDEVSACGLNFVRIFSGAYRETDGSFNIADNTLSPRPGRSVVPWMRTQIPGAIAGEKKYDLTRWDPAYYYRLRDFATAASRRGIVVELTLFGAYYDDGLWNLSPLNAANHVNGAGAAGRAGFFDPAGDLVPYQKALARKCATELRDFDNVILEVCNEPYQQNVSAAWETMILDELAATGEESPPGALLALNTYNYQGVVTSPHPAVSLFNFHYALPAAASGNYGLNRALGDDETGNAGQEDFTYRREAWEFMLSGGGLFNHLDFSFTTTREDGIASQAAPGGGGPAIRRQLGVLRWFLEDLPLLELEPQPGFVAGGVPANGAATVIGAPGAAYAIYLRGGSQANPIFNLPAGTWRGQWIDTRSGRTSSTVAAFPHPGGQITLASPAYTDDIALRLFAGDFPPPEVLLASPSYNRLVSSTTASLTLTAEASLANGTLEKVEFLDGEKLLGAVTSEPYQLDLAKLDAGPHVFRAKATTTDGRSATSPPVKTTVIGPYHTGVNLNGGPLTVDGVPLQSQPDAATAGLTVTNSQPVTTSGTLTLYPAPDGPTGLLLTNQLLRLSAAGNTELGITYPVPDGYYEVYLYIVEDQASHSRNMRLLVEGQLLARGIGDLAKGEWHKYGPYRTRVTDGVLSLGLQQDTKGVPKIAGFTIHLAAAPLASSEVKLGIGKFDGVVVLSYPPGLTNAKVQTSESLMDTWQDLGAPVSFFSDQDVVAVPVDRPLRFFRLKMDPPD